MFKSLSPLTRILTCWLLIHDFFDWRMIVEVQGQLPWNMPRTFVVNSCFSDRTNTWLKGMKMFSQHWRKAIRGKGHPTNSEPRRALTVYKTTVKQEDVFVSVKPE